MLMLELADGTPARFVSVLVPSRARHWIEVYGDRGTLVLGSDNQITFMVFALGAQRDKPMAEQIQASRLSSNLPRWSHCTVYG